MNASFRPVLSSRQRRSCSLYVFVGLVVAGLLPGVAATDAHGLELAVPQPGTRMAWQCTGPFTSRYDLTVTSVDKDIVRYEGEIDAGHYFAEKHAALTGTSLWSRLYGDRRQWFDFEALSEYRALKPGESFETAVPAQHGTDRWVWQYNIRLGQLRSMYHPKTGAVRVVQVVERRRVFHGDYWSRMKTVLAPDLGLSVSWEYEDQDGLERCDLVAYHAGPGSSVLSDDRGLRASARVSALNDRVGRKK